MPPEIRFDSAKLVIRSESRMREVRPVREKDLDLFFHWIGSYRVAMPRFDNSRTLPAIG